MIECIMDRGNGMEKRVYLSKLAIIECKKKFKENYSIDHKYKVFLSKDKHGQIYVAPDIFRYSLKVHLIFTKQNNKTLIEALFKNAWEHILGTIFIIIYAVGFLIAFLMVLSEKHNCMYLVIMLFLGGLSMLFFCLQRSLKKTAWNMVEKYILNELQSEML